MKNIHDMNWNEIAAIVGYWRNGMTLEEICMVADVSQFDAERICFNHTKGIIPKDMPPKARFKKRIKC